MFQCNPGTEIFIKPLDFVMLPLDAQYSLHPFGESEHAGLKSLHNHTCLWVEVESSRGCQGAAGEEVGSVSYPVLVAGAMCVVRVGVGRHAVGLLTAQI